MSQTCKPSYSENKEQEHSSWKPILENSSPNTILKESIIKKKGWQSGSSSKSAKR
jgi:hypothetical protein